MWKAYCLPPLLMKRNYHHSVLSDLQSLSDDLLSFPTRDLLLMLIWPIMIVRTLKEMPSLPKYPPHIYRSDNSCILFAGMFFVRVASWTMNQWAPSTSILSCLTHSSLLARSASRVSNSCLVPRNKCHCWTAVPQKRAIFIYGFHDWVFL